MPERTPYHEGELAVQHRAGVASGAAKVGRIIHPTIPPVAADFLAQRPFVVLGAEDGVGRVWASFLTGRPGFASVPAPNVVALARGPAHSDPLEALFPGHAVGLLAIDLQHRKRMRVNGRMATVGPPMLIDVAEAYSNCAKYIQSRIVDVGEMVGGGTEDVTVSIELTPELRAMIASSDTFFIASVHRERGADVSHRGGPPGFVVVEDDGAIVWPDYAGNMMFNTLGNLAVDRRAGLLFPDFYGGRTVQLSGAAVIDWDRRVDTVPGAERFVRFVPDRVVVRRGAIYETAFLGWSPHNPTD